MKQKNQKPLIKKNNIYILWKHSYNLTVKSTVELTKTVKAKPSRSGLNYFVKTFGCQMNEHDSERIAGLFEYDGMLKATSIDDADILFVNTLMVRGVV